MPTFDIPLPPTPLCQDPLITTLEKPAVEAVERRFSHTYKYLHANANEHFVKPLTLKTMCTHCTVNRYTSLDASLFTSVRRLTSLCVFKGLVCECVHVCVCERAFVHQRRCSDGVHGVCSPGVLSVWTA